MIHNALKLAMRNRNTLANSSKAGCFKCLRIFEVAEIKEYTDHGETAVCPNCENDTVIADNGLTKVDEAFLKEVQNFLFKD